MPSLYPQRSNVPTPLGVALALASDGERIVASTFVRKRVTTAARPSDALLREASAQVRAYFKRKLRRFDLPLLLRGTEFEVSVWDFVAHMDFADIISYGDLARILDKPRAARGVARAMSRSPLDLLIPAHRVVGADGSVRGAAPGSLRRRLLTFEGVTLK